MNRFFPDMKISAAHGKAFRKEVEWLGKSQVFFALYHPAAALHNGSMRDVLKADFMKLPKLLKKINEETIATNTKENLN